MRKQKLPVSSNGSGDALQSSCSFSSDTKQDILSAPLSMRCCRETFFFSFLEIGTDQFSLSLPYAHRRQLLDTLKTIAPPWAKIREENGCYVLQPTNPDLLTRAFKHRFDSIEPGPRPHCLKAFLKGLFLRGGYLQNPQEAYHLEIIIPEGEFATFFQFCMHQLRLPFKLCQRDHRLTAYLKARLGIRKFLKTLELYDRQLAFDDLLATRTLLGQVNRQVNFETANIKKSVTASEKICAPIRRLLAYPDQSIWSEALRSLALRRLEFPFESLESLGKRCTPPLTKTAVNHRLRRISLLYRHLFGDPASSLEAF